jgi:hypothetical protein
MTLIYFCTLTPPTPNPSPHLPPPPMHTLPHHSLLVNLRGVGGIAAPPPDPKPPRQTLSVSLPIHEQKMRTVWGGGGVVNC